MKIENLCNFYASKYHLSIILLEYLKRNSTKKTQIVTFMQEDIRSEIQDLNEKYKYNINLNKENFQRINNIYEIEPNITKDMIFIVQGNMGYMKEANEYIIDLVDKKANIKIINCYDFEKQKKDMKELINQNDKILYTTGEKIID